MTMTRSQIEQLGARLVRSKPPTAEDLAALHDLLVSYGDALAEAVVTVQATLGLTPSSRVKTTGTILEKLERYGGSWLKSLQDLAGMRIVGAFDRAGQDELVAELVALFADGARSPRVIDRRAEPSHGYRAVHVVVFVTSLPVEIQVRTELQHEWAELFEKLADEIGRGIRYGEPPEQWLDPVRREVLSSQDRTIHEQVYRVRCTLVAVAQRIAETIDRYEVVRRQSPEDPRLLMPRENIDRALASLTTAIDVLSEVEISRDV